MGRERNIIKYQKQSFRESLPRNLLLQPNLLTTEDNGGVR